MEWERLIEETAESAGRSESETEAVLNAFLDTLVSALKREDSVGLRRDFGTFTVRESGGEAKSERRPQIVKKQRSVVFKTAGGLQKQLRQSDEEYLEMLEALGAHAQAELVQKKMQNNRLMQEKQAAGKTL